MSIINNNLSDEKWPKLVWVLDPGDKRNGTTIVRQLSRKAKFELFYYDNLHLYPKHIPTQQDLHAYYNEHPPETSELSIQDQFHIAETSDRVMHQEAKQWLQYYEAFEAMLKKTNESRSRQRQKIQRQLKKLDDTDLEAYNKLQLELKSLTDNPPQLGVDESANNDDNELYQTCFVNYQEALKNTKSPKLRRQYYLLKHCFGAQDLLHFLEIHSADDALGETETHYAAPHHMGLKINRLIPLVNAYGEFWETCYGRPTSIVVESQAAPFGVYNLTTQQTVATIMSCAAWRRDINIEPTAVRVVQGDHKNSVHVLQPAEQALLRNLGYASEKYWKVARHPVYINIKPIPVEIRVQLPRLWPFAQAELEEKQKKADAKKKGETSKRAKVTVRLQQGDNGQPITARTQHVMRQAELALNGEMTAAEKRRQNKEEAVATTKDLLEDNDIASQVLVGYKWLLRARYYWTEHQKRDPADAILTAIYALTCGSHEEEEQKAEMAAAKAREKKRDKKRKRKDVTSDDEDENLIIQPPASKKKKPLVAAKKVATPVIVDDEEDEDGIVLTAKKTKTPMMVDLSSSDDDDYKVTPYLNKKWFK